MVLILSIVLFHFHFSTVLQYPTSYSTSGFWLSQFPSYVQLKPTRQEVTSLTSSGLEASHHPHAETVGHWSSPSGICVGTHLSSKTYISLTKDPAALVPPSPEWRNTFQSSWAVKPTSSPMTTNVSNDPSSFLSARYHDLTLLTNPPSFMQNAGTLTQSCYLAMLEAGMSLIAMNIPSVWLLCTKVVPEKVVRSIRSMVSLTSGRSSGGDGTAASPTRRTDSTTNLRNDSTTLSSSQPYLFRGDLEGQKNVKGFVLQDMHSTKNEEHAPSC